MNINHFKSNHIQDVKEKFNATLCKYYSTNEQDIIFKRILEHLNYDPYSNNSYFNQSELILISRFIDDLLEKKPLAYILGYTYFYHLNFFVSPNVLIPRPETEELVLLTQKIISEKYPSHSNLTLIDIGTGSGCIAITLKKYFPKLQITAIDISEEAIQTAMNNATFHNTPIHFLQSDILSDYLPGLFDIIISNPPYIPTQDITSIDESIQKYEPSIALFSKNFSEFYEKIFALSEKQLNKNGILIMELNQYYAQSILDLSKKFHHFSHTTLLKDWSNHQRFILCEKN